MHFLRSSYRCDSGGLAGYFRLTGNYARLLAKNRDRFIERIVCALTWLYSTFLGFNGLTLDST
jgi:hypothetical protein